MIDLLRVELTKLESAAFVGPAIEELIARYKPQRILLETSGSSHPAPLAWELRRLSAAGLPVHLDALIVVIDCVNFTSYEDRSHTARLQTKFTDLILINKHEIASEEQTERVLDSVTDLNPSATLEHSARYQHQHPLQAHLAVTVPCAC